jgi:effector-binding domain-containing protein
MTIQFVTVPAIVAVSTVLCHAQATQPAQRDFAITPMRVQQLAGAETFVYADGDTMFPNLKQTIDRLMDIVQPLRNDRNKVAGEYIFVYFNATMEPDKPFKLHVGFPVKPGVAAPAGAKVRKLESIKAATVVYSGDLSHIPEAFGELFTQISAAGLQPTGECRENYIYWEGPESTNNVIIIQAAVK